MQKNIVLATAFITMVSYADTLQVPEQYSTIQSAIDASSDGDSISIAAGTYNEALSTDGKAIALFGRDGASSTTIDASGLNGSAIKCMNGEDSGTIIASLTLTGGTGTINPVWETLHGGGIFIYQASPIVVNCVITGNTAEYGGGGAWVQDSTSMFKNVVFENNQVLFDTRGGGGMYSWNSSPSLNKCSFAGNTSDSGGAFKAKGGGTPTLRRCRFVNNQSTAEGGAISTQSSAPTFQECVFEDNTAVTHGSSASIIGDGTIFHNCYFTDNSTDITGGAIRYYEASGTVDSCDFFNNSADLGGGAIVVNNSTTIVSNSNFQENSGGAGGGAIDIVGTSTVSVMYSTFCGNTTTQIDGNWDDLGDNTMTSSCNSVCVGDIDADGEVGVMDAITLIAEFGTCNGVDSCFSDQDNNGEVDIADLLLVMSNWGFCD